MKARPWPSRSQGERQERKAEALKEIIKRKEQIFQGEIFNVERVVVELPNGQEGIRDIVRHPGAVAILAVNDNGDILLEKQYRTALDQIIFEIPAGKVDLGEDRETAALRELEEETGYSAQNIEFLGDVALAAGYSDEVISVYLAQGLIAGKDKPDEDEFLEWEFIPKDMVMELIRANFIKDSKTICAMLYWEMKTKTTVRNQEQEVNIKKQILKK